MTKLPDELPSHSDTERLNWLESKLTCGRVMFSTSRVTGLSSLHSIKGDTKGMDSVREVIDKEIYLERRRKLGFKT